jgi:hypothetical protein
MKFAVAVWLLALLPSVAVRAQQEAVDGRIATATSLFPLFITCDVREEFVTQDVDPRTVAWFDTPVSKDGAWARAEALIAGAGKIVQVPLVLHVNLENRHRTVQVFPMERGRTRRATAG